MNVTPMCEKDKALARFELLDLNSLTRSPPVVSLLVAATYDF